MTMDVAASARIAGRWLGIDLDEAQRRAEIIVEAAAVYVRASDGRAALVDAIGRVLLARPTLPYPKHLSDFRAGWRSDYVAPQAP